MDEAKTLNHSIMGVQISRSVYSEVQEKKPLQGIARRFGSGISGAGKTQGL